VSRSSVWVAAPVGWTVAFALWLVFGEFSVSRFTLIFWVVTALVAFTVGRRPWWQAPLDWAPFVVFFLVYDYTRGIASTFGFPTHWELPARLDRVLGLGEVPSVWLQERFVAPYDAIPWWETIMSIVYLSFFVVPFVLAGALWIRSRSQFVRFMTRLMIVSAIAVIGYVVVPSAPPWAAARCTHAEVADHPANPQCLYDNRPTDRRETVLRGIHPDNGFSPVVQRITSRGFTEIPGMHLTGGFIRSGIDASNPVAAVPSLHAAEALLVAVFAWPLVRRRWRPLLALYPVAMGFALVWGGDHYIFDILLGWGVVALVTAALARFERQPSREEELEPAVVLA
jgi:PAP2 superfamily protein